MGENHFSGNFRRSSPPVKIYRQPYSPKKGNITQRKSAPTCRPIFRLAEVAKFGERSKGSSAHHWAQLKVEHSAKLLRPIPFPETIFPDSNHRLRVTAAQQHRLGSRARTRPAASTSNLQTIRRRSLPVTYTQEKFGCPLVRLR